MKINEVTQPSDQTLLEEFSKDTNVSLKPEQMLEIYRESVGSDLKVITEEDLWNICFGSDDK